MSLDERTMIFIFSLARMSLGTVMYSALTVVLHPLTVAKIQRQVARKGQPAGSSPPSTGAFFDNIRQYYRGLGVVVCFAIPARIIYISTLEYSREQLDTNARHFLSNPPAAVVDQGGKGKAKPIGAKASKAAVVDKGSKDKGSKGNNKHGKARGQGLRQGQGQ